LESGHRGWLRPALILIEILGAEIVIND